MAPFLYTPVDNKNVNKCPSLTLEKISGPAQLLFAAKQPLAASTYKTDMIYMFPNLLSFG